MSSLAPLYTVLRRVAQQRIRRDDDYEYRDTKTGKMCTDAVYQTEDRGWVALHCDGSVSLTVDGERRIGISQSTPPVPVFSDGTR